MPHEILSNRFLQRDTFGRPAWHKLGITFPTDKMVLASEAVQQVAGDVAVEARPLYYIGKGGAYVQAGEHQAIVRSPLPDDPDEKVFGVVTGKWSSVSYPALARAMDELSRTYKVETCGLIQEGSLCFLSLRGPDFSVKGDEMNDYFIANFSNQPGVAHRVLAAPVRVVCFNTNLMAQERSSISLSIPHSAQAANRIALASTLVARFREMTTKTQETFEAMANLQVTREGLDRIFQAAWPNPSLPAELRLLQTAMRSTEQGVLEKTLGSRFQQIVKAQEKYDRDQKSVLNLRATALERFEAFNPANLRGTLWAAYNAVTEVSDWREGRNADTASVWGNRAREKAAAFTAALALIERN